MFTLILFQGYSHKDTSNYLNIIMKCLLWCEKKNVAHYLCYLLLHHPVNHNQIFNLNGFCIKKKKKNSVITSCRNNEKPTK